MRVALIDPPGINRGLNIGLAMLAAVLEKRGHTVKVVDLNNDFGGIRGRITGVLDYDIIGISIKSSTWQGSVRITQQLGRDDLICGGPQVTLDAINTLRENRSFKLGVSGEAEELIIKILENWQNDDVLSNLPGVLSRNQDNPGVIRGWDTPNLVADLDTLPLAAYACFDSVHKQITDYPVITSRGCPHPCSYCCVGKISGRKIRFRGIEKVLAEIEQAKTKYNSKAFHILDDNFTFETERAKEFCRALIKSGINLPWSCPNGIRADCLDEELISLMAQSGCRQASIGIESWDEEVFANIKKGEERVDIECAIQLFKKYRVKVNGFFMIGLPGDSFKKSLRSLKGYSSLGLSSAHWNLFVPYPGTEASEWVNKNTRILRDWKEGYHFGRYAKAVFEAPGFSAKEMLYFYKVANIRSKNYSAFFAYDKPAWNNIFYILALILRYDALHILAHLKYVLSNLVSVRRYFKTK